MKKNNTEKNMETNAENTTTEKNIKNNTEKNIENNTEYAASIEAADGRFDLEAALARLETIAGILENQDTPLRDALDVYGEGVKLIKACRDNLCDVEKEMIVLSKEGENDV